MKKAKVWKLTLEVVEGMQFDRGYLSPYFVTNADKNECRSRRCVNSDLRQENHRHERSASILESIAKIGHAHYLIIAEDVEGEALATLVVNKIRGTLMLPQLKLLVLAIVVKPCLKISPFLPAAK